MIGQVMSQNTARVRQAVRVPAGFGVQHDSRGFESRGGKDDHPRKHLFILLRSAIEESDSLRLTFLIDDNMSHHGVCAQGEFPGSLGIGQCDSRSREKGSHVTSIPTTPATVTGG